MPGMEKWVRAKSAEFLLIQRLGHQTFGEAKKLLRL